VQLTHEVAEGYFHFRRCEAGAVGVGDRTLTTSFLMAPDRIVEGWPVVDAAGFDLAAVDAVLALQPEVVLLGTGETQQFPPREAMAALLSRGIGIEVMGNAAACRTYNLLASEGRRVVAAILLGGAAGA